VVRDADYQIIAGYSYKIGENNILRRRVLEHERPIILAKTHEGIVGGNYVGKDTAHKLLRS